jgi:hypothetical protein
MTKKFDRLPQGAQRHKGVVVFAALKEDRPWGFNEPAGSSGDRSENIFYGSKSVVGEVMPQRGDEVEFLIDRKEIPGRNRVAFRLWIVKPAIEDDAITILPGEFEVDPL